MPKQNPIVPKDVQEEETGNPVEQVLPTAEVAEVAEEAAVAGSPVIIAKRELVPKFTCSSANLYSVARLGWNYYDAFQPQFEALNNYFKPGISADARKAITDAEALPDYQQRIEPRATAVVEMKGTNPELLWMWQNLAFAIRRAYPNTADIELQAAGQNYYREAQQKQWGNVESLVTKTNEYLTLKEATLIESGGLPVAFKADFAAEGVTFIAERNRKTAASGTAKTLTSEKMLANNAVYDTLMEMLDMGKIVTRFNKQDRWKFVFASLLNEVRGQAGAMLKGIIADSVARRAVAGAHIRALLLDKNMIATEYVGVSDENGRFELKLTGGDFRITVSAPGYEDFVVENRRLRPGVKARLEVPLLPAAMPVAPPVPDYFMGNMAPAPASVEGNGAAG